MMQLDIDAIRSQFPALARIEGATPVAYLDGPGGTQTPLGVIEAMSTVLTSGVSNLEGGFGASRDADEIVHLGRVAVSDLLGASPAEISFGQNMTSITFAVSRALASTWKPGDAIVTTSLDHDANYTPWIRAAADAGVEVRVAEFDDTTGILDPSAIAEVLDDRVRLVAICLASNSLGTVVDVTSISAMAHEVGALVYVDAVHAAPHRLIDIQKLDCDFLVASAYKFFGPHTGMLFGRLEHLASLDFYKVRPAPSDPPGKMETGTQSFEAIAGVTAAVDYLASLSGPEGNRRKRLGETFRRISEYESNLALRFGKGLATIPEARIHGLPADDTRRVPTFAVSVAGKDPRGLASNLAERGIYTWSGHYYAVNVMDRLGTLEAGGLLRVGFVHYNTEEEVDRVVEALASLA